MFEQTEKYISYSNGKLFYTIAGSGPTVVLLHGFGEDHTIWENQVSVLQQQYSLILPDIPGSGRSTMLRNDRIILMDDYAECINAILLAEGIKKCVMIGHSMGGYITLAFAEKYPGKLTALGLFHSSAYADDKDKRETRKKANGFMRSNGAAAFLETSIPGLFYNAEMSRKDIASLLKKGNNFTAETLIQYYEAMMERPDRTSILKKINIPVLFVIGNHDKAVPFQHSLEQSTMPAYSFVTILRNSAHMGMLEEKEKANKTLADFLETIQLK